MLEDSSAVHHCACGAALNDADTCSASTCYVSAPDTHLRNPTWSSGVSLCGRSSGRGGE